STTSVQLALSLYQKGFKVGVLDIDLCGPSIPRMFGIDEKNVMQSEQGWVPVYVDGECRLTVMSIAFLLPKKDASVVWRGPKKTSMIRQFLSDVVWGELDYLIIDTPPGKMLIAHVKGTSDEHISVIEFLQGCHLDGAVLVTTPQVVAFNDVRKEINFCKTVGLPILGLIENMSGYVCPCCNETTNIFSTGGGKILADEKDNQ
ncbi:nucleotide binding protein 2, partial [Rozella allomycis CSF55]